MATFEALLGTFYNDGVAVELGSGVDCKSGITASRNVATRRVDLQADAAQIVRDSWTWRGDTTSIPATTPTAIKLDEAATSIAVGDIVDPDQSVQLTIRVWYKDEPEATNIYHDTLHVALYRDGTPQNLHLVDCDSVGNTASGSGDLTLDIDGPCSGHTYTIGARYTGPFTITTESLTYASYMRATIWVGGSWVVL